MTDLTNTAPKRIYLDIGDQFALERVASGDLRWDLLDGVTWSEDNATSHGIPYVRADLVPTPAASGAAPAVPEDVLILIDKYGDARADDAGSSIAIGELVLGLRRWAAALASPQVAPDPVPLTDRGAALWDAINKYADTCYLRAIHHDPNEWLKDPNEPRITHVEVIAAEKELRRLFDAALAAPAPVAPTLDFKAAFMDMPGMSSVRQHELWAEADPGHVEGRDPEGEMCWRLATFARLLVKDLAPVAPTPAQPSEWQPIETAPQRGIILLGLTPNEEHEDGYVSPGYWMESDDDGPDNMGHDAGFVDVHFDFFTCARSIGNPAYQHKGLQPTHWQPLPPPPLPSEPEGESA